jgi:hypothetical protein
VFAEVDDVQFVFRAVGDGLLEVKGKAEGDAVAARTAGDDRNSHGVLFVFNFNVQTSNIVPFSRFCHFATVRWSERVVVELDLLVFAADTHIDEFHEHTEGDGRVDVALVDVLMEAFGDQHHPDHDEERQSKYL